MSLYIFAKKILIIWSAEIALALVILLLAGCGQAEENSSSTQEETVYIYDSTTSELSNVMRQMYDEALAAKDKVKAGEAVSLDHALLQKIKTAEATSPDMKEGSYPKLAEQFLLSAKELSTNREDQVSAYNVMVVNCLNCHANRCPGPIPKIKRLEIANL